MNKQFWIGIGVVAASAAAWYIHTQVKLTEKLCFKAIGYKLNKLSVQATQIQIILQIRNLGDLAVKIKSYEFNIFGNDHYLATAYSEGESLIQPNGVVDVTVNVALNPKILLQSIGSILMSGGGWKNIELMIDGSLSVAKGGIPFRIPIVHAFRLSELTSKEPDESRC